MIWKIKNSRYTKQRLIRETARRGAT